MPVPLIAIAGGVAAVGGFYSALVFPLFILEEAVQAAGFGVYNVRVEAVDENVVFTVVS